MGVGGGGGWKTSVEKKWSHLIFFQVHPHLQPHPHGVCRCLLFKFVNSFNLLHSSLSTQEHTYLYMNVRNYFHKVLGGKI